MQLGQLIGREPEQAAEDLLVVLAEARGAPGDRPVGPRQVHREPVHPDVAHLGVVHRRPHAPRRRDASWSMRSSGLATAAAGTPAASTAAPPRGGPGSASTGEQPVELVLMGQPAGEPSKRSSAVHGSPIRCGQARPVVVVPAGQGHPVILAGGRVDAVGGHGRRARAVGVGHPGTAQRPAVDREVEDGGAVQGGAGLGARHVDPLAPPVRFRWIMAARIASGHEVGAHVVHVRVAPTRPAG